MHMATANGQRRGCENCFVHLPLQQEPFFQVNVTVSQWQCHDLQHAMLRTGADTVGDLVQISTKKSGLGARILDPCNMIAKRSGLTAWILDPGQHGRNHLFWAPLILESAPKPFLLNCCGAMILFWLFAVFVGFGYRGCYFTLGAGGYGGRGECQENC